MTLHPITVVDQVLEEYRAYLSTEFRASDEKLQGRPSRRPSTSRASSPRSHSSRPIGPSSRASRGRTWARRTPGQGDARARSGSETAYRCTRARPSRHLLSDKAGPLVVTTGTGSGKTECFLLPVIQNAIEDSVRL